MFSLAWDNNFSCFWICRQIYLIIEKSKGDADLEVFVASELATETAAAAAAPKIGRNAPTEENGSLGSKGWRPNGGCWMISKLKLKIIRTNGCGTVAQTVAFYVRDPWFESCQLQFFIYRQLYWKTKIKKKEAGNGPFDKKNSILRWLKTLTTSLTILRYASHFILNYYLIQIMMFFL